MRAWGAVVSGVNAVFARCVRSYIMGVKAGEMPRMLAVAPRHPIGSRACISELALARLFGVRAAGRERISPARVTKGAGPIACHADACHAETVLVIVRTSSLCARVHASALVCLRKPLAPPHIYWLPDLLVSAYTLDMHCSCTTRPHDKHEPTHSPDPQPTQCMRTRCVWCGVNTVT